MRYGFCFFFLVFICCTAVLAAIGAAISTVYTTRELRAQHRDALRQHVRPDERSDRRAHYAPWCGSDPDTTDQNLCPLSDNDCFTTRCVETAEGPRCLVFPVTFACFPQPTMSPTLAPTESPTESPTEAPTEQPTAAPSEAPTASPTHTPSSPFIFRIFVAQPGPVTFRLPLYPAINGSAYNFFVDWGDGSPQQHYNNSSPLPVEHNYSAAFAPNTTTMFFNITIDGQLWGWSFFFEGLSASQVIYIYQWGTNFVPGGNTVFGAFSGCYNLIALPPPSGGARKKRAHNPSSPIGYSAPRLFFASRSQPLISLRSFFMGCAQLYDIESIGDWDVSQVQLFHYMFADDVSLNASSTAWSEWNTSSATSFSGMFFQSNFNGAGIELWDVSRVQSFANAFYSMPSTFDPDLGAWNVSSALEMQFMFAFSSNYSGRGVETWRTPLVLNLAQTFSFTAVGREGSTAPNAFIDWQVGSCTNFNGVFFGCAHFAGLGVDYWNVSSARHMQYMFSGTNISSGLDMSDWDTSKVQFMQYMFEGATNLQHIWLHAWNTSQVQDMRSMFQFTPQFTDNFAGWDTRNVLQMRYMFAGASSFDSDLSAWSVSKCSDFEFMFYDAHMFQGAGLHLWNVSNSVDFSHMFEGAYSFDSDLSAWNVSKCRNFMQMFAETWMFQGVGVESWNVSRGEHFGGMFHNAVSFNADLSAWVFGPGASPYFNDHMANFLRNATKYNFPLRWSRWNLPAGALDLAYSGMDVCSVTTTLQWIADRALNAAPGDQPQHSFTIDLSGLVYHNSTQTQAALAVLAGLPLPIFIQNGAEATPSSFSAMCVDSNNEFCNETHVASLGCYSDVSCCQQTCFDDRFGCCCQEFVAPIQHGTWDAACAAQCSMRRKR